MWKIQIKKGDDYEEWRQHLKEEIFAKAKSLDHSRPLPKKGIKLRGPNSLVQLLIPKKQLEKSIKVQKEEIDANNGWLGCYKWDT